MPSLYVHLSLYYLQKLPQIMEDNTIDHLKKVFEASKAETLVKGFAVGRTIFSQAANLWLSGKINDKQATNMMSERFLNVIKTWNEIRS